MKNLFAQSKKSIRSVALASILIYQKVLSPDHGLAKNFFRTARCRFYPTCSVYAAESIRQYGLLKGSVVSLKRILRCNPFYSGGYDPMS